MCFIDWAWWRPGCRGGIKFRNLICLRFSDLALWEAGLFGRTKLGRPKLPVFQRLGFVGAQAVWVAKVLGIKLVCVLAAGFGGGWAAGWDKDWKVNLFAF